MAGLTERLSILIETVGSGKAAADFNKMGNAAGGLVGNLKEGKLGLAGLAGQAGITSGMLRTGLVAGAAAAATGLVALGQKGVNAFTELAEQIMMVQRVSGASAEDASRLVAVADDLGVSVTSVATSVFNLGKNIDKLPSFGVKIAKDANGATNLANTLVNVADAYVATADPAQRAQLITAAFGKAGKDLIPIVERGGQGIRDMYAAADEGGLIMDQADLDTARTFSLVMDELADTIQGGLVSVGRELLPILIDLGVTVGKVSDRVNDLNDSLAGKGIVQLVKTLVPGIRVAEGLAWALDAVAGAEGDARESATAAEAAFAEQELAMDELTKTSFGLVAADRAVAAASRDVVSANRNLADAQKTLNELLRDGAVDEQKVADARRSLAEATRSAADADRGLTKAQKEYDEAVAAAAALGGLDTALEDVADKAENLTDAQDTSTSAHERAETAARELREAQAGDPEFQDKLADARLKVADNTQKVADAEYNLSQRTFEASAAHDAEAIAIAGKSDQVGRLRGELETMLALNPQLEAFLAPVLAALQFDSAGGGDFAGGGGFFSNVKDLAVTATSAPAAPTNNITINAPQQAEPMHIAREMLWALN